MALILKIFENHAKKFTQLFQNTDPLLYSKIFFWADGLLQKSYTVHTV